MNKTNYTVKKWKALFTCKVLCITFNKTKDYEKFLVAGPIVILHFGSLSQHVFTFVVGPKHCFRSFRNRAYVH